MLFSENIDIHNDLHYCKTIQCTATLYTHELIISVIILLSFVTFVTYYVWRIFLFLSLLKKQVGLVRLTFKFLALKKCRDKL